MNFRVPFFIALLLALLSLAQKASAHTPFDCSARIILHTDSVEVILITGTALGENFLRPANVSPGQLPSGHPFHLAPGFATNFVTAYADGKILEPRAADVIAANLEFSFNFEYAIGPARTFGLESKFIPALNPPRIAPLVLTDENANLLASAILSPEKTGTEFALPTAFAPPAAPPAASERATKNLPVDVPVTVAVKTKPQPSFREFLKLGISHILAMDAADHLLFLAALLLGCRKLKPMLLVITGFTVAHSITLALAALNVVTLPPRVVEPAIAASIIFVALENFRASEKKWQRYALTCGFGLIHGFGFAGALRASRLAGNGREILQPLLAFNLGVEIGQLTAVAVMLPLLLLLERWPWFARHGTRVISALVVLVALVWLGQRLR